MDELVDTYGEEFVQGLKGEIAQRQAERESVSDNAKLGIADMAVNEQSFGAGDPTFQYTDDETGITHDVLLMQTPDPESKTFYSMMRELDSGAVTAPLLYLGEFYSCLFNDPDMPKALEPGEWYIVIGELGQWEDDQGRTHDQLSPVRGVMTQQEAKQLAEKALDDKPISEPEKEPSETVNEPDEEDMGEDVSESPFVTSENDDDDDEGVPVTQEEIDELVEGFAEKDDVVWELDEGHEHFDHLVEAVAANASDVDENNEDHIQSIGTMVMDRIVREQEEEEDDEDDAESGLFGR